MGFSVSGSAAIIFAGLLIGFSIFYGAASNTVERVSDARQERADDLVEQRNIDIEFALYDDNGQLEVGINNNGSKSLSVSKTDIIVDNTYETPTETKIVYDDGTTDPDTDVWEPGTRLNMTVDVSSPSRVKVVTEHGVAVSIPVEDNTWVVF